MGVEQQGPKCSRAVSQRARIARVARIAAVVSQLLVDWNTEATFLTQLQHPAPKSNFRCNTAICTLEGVYVQDSGGSVQEQRVSCNKLFGHTLKCFFVVLR